MLEEITSGGGLEEGWTRRELATATEEWIWRLRRNGLPTSGLFARAAAESRRLGGVPGFIERIGPADFVKLVVAKGRELEALEEQEKIDGQQVRMVFRLVHGRTG